MIIRTSISIACLVLTFSGGAAFGAATLTGESRIIPQAYVTIAKSHGVPPRVLYSMALVESGKRISKGVFRPYPWTLNVRGKGQRFGSAAETVARLREVMRKGITNVDVGLVQTNMHWHGRRYKSLGLAVDPWSNVNVAATILLEEYNRCGKKDWWCAAGRYHSYRPTHGENYVASLKKYYSQLLEPHS